MQNNDAKRKIRSIVERIERLEEDKKSVQDDIKEVYAEAKGEGYDVAVLRKLIALRRQDQDTRREQEEILALYMDALGMLSDTPLGRSAVQREFGVIGKPVPLTDLEREMGVSAAFENKDGMRSTMSVGDAAASVAKKAGKGRKTIAPEDAMMAG